MTLTPLNPKPILKLFAGVMRAYTMQGAPKCSQITDLSTDQLPAMGLTHALQCLSIGQHPEGTLE
jgi:hypothetical protein